MNKGKLEITTPTERDIRMTRVFQADRVQVFEAYTRPELVQRWLGAFGGWTLDVCEIDLRVGGRYRYVWRNADGREMGMGGVYREVVPNERLVNTETFDDPWYEGEAVGTAEFIEHAGRTALVTTVRYSSKEIRDSVLKSNMEHGVAASYDQLEELVHSNAATAS